MQTLKFAVNVTIMILRIVNVRPSLTLIPVSRKTSLTSTPESVTLSLNLKLM